MSDAIHSEERAEDWSSATCSAFFGCAKMRVGAFDLERYCSRLGYAPTDGWDFATQRPKRGFVVTGWTHSASLYHLRPNEHGFAVMMYEEPREERVLFSSDVRQVGGEEFWFHIPWPNK